MASGDVSAEAWGWYWKDKKTQQDKESEQLYQDGQAQRRMSKDTGEVLRNTKCSPYCLNGNYK